MTLLPEARLLPLTATDADPLDTGTEPSAVFPAEKATLPVGAVLPVAGFTVAVTCVVPVAVILIGLAATVVVVVTGGNATLTVTVPVELLKLPVAT
jgi:hypothetical protein